jgi:hypoxanthine phosphoribosyltransferase
MKSGQQDTVNWTWEDVQSAVDKIAEQVKHVQWDTIVAVMRGGLVPARMVAAKLGVKNMAVWDGGSRWGDSGWTLGDMPGNVLIVDDICDTGQTVERAKRTFGAPVAVLVSKSPVADYIGVWMGEDERWVVFPWEGRADKLNSRQSLEK